MPKKRLELSTKHQKLIELLVSLPDQKDIGTIALMEGVAIDCRGTAFDAVCDALLMLSAKTQSEDICKDIVDKAKKLYLHRIKEKDR